MDMVRISDARMSGTSYGACVLHVSPETALGGPLAFVKDGDIIELDIEKRVINLLVKQSELDIRKKNGFLQRIKQLEVTLNSSLNM